MLPDWKWTICWASRQAQAHSFLITFLSVLDCLYCPLSLLRQGFTMKYTTAGKIPTQRTPNFYILFEKVGATNLPPKKCLCSDQPHQLAISYNIRTPWVSCELWEVGPLPAHPKNDQFIWDLGLFEVGFICVPLQKQLRSVSRNTLSSLLARSTARTCCCHGGVYITWYVTKENLCIILTVHSHNDQGSLYIMVDQCVGHNYILCCLRGKIAGHTFKQG